MLFHFISQYIHKNISNAFRRTYRKIINTFPHIQSF